jgi:D-alanyl-D-alanine carboxypeptidase
MGLVRGSHYFIWGSLAALLCAGPANPQRDVEAALARLDGSAVLADSDADVARPDATAGRPDQDATAVRADPTVKVALTDPEINATQLKASDECVLAQECIDQYLWSVYERARKIDTIKVKQRIKATVKKKGKSRTVMKTVTKLVDEDFTWKDPHAAQKVGMSMMEYVIGGMERSFRLRLYRLFRALDEAGLAPGMTSGFRDDYRQSIASGNKAASDSSYHGGSRRGGYGHGLAADVVSVKGETRAERWISSEALWKWIDAHGKEFGIGRPYLDRDPPHIAPIDGKEYAAKRGGNVKRAGL